MVSQLHTLNLDAMKNEQLDTEMLENKNESIKESFSNKKKFE